MYNYKKLVATIILGVVMAFSAVAYADSHTKKTRYSG
jgi:hypothetical protein